MDDLNYGLKHPSFIDLKIGGIVNPETISSLKIERSKIKYPILGKIGYQIEGMKVSILLLCIIYTVA